MCVSVCVCVCVCVRARARARDRDRETQREKERETDDNDDDDDFARLYYNDIDESMKCIMCPGYPPTSEQQRGFLPRLG